jgi:hypothetical protein
MQNAFPNFLFEAKDEGMPPFSRMHPPQANLLLIHMAAVNTYLADPSSNHPLAIMHQT